MDGRWRFFELEYGSFAFSRAFLSGWKEMGLMEGPSEIDFSRTTGDAHSMGGVIGPVKIGVLNDM